MGVAGVSAKRSRAVAAAVCSSRAQRVWHRGAAGHVFGVFRAQGVVKPAFLACYVLSYVYGSGSSRNFGHRTSFFAPDTSMSDLELIHITCGIVGIIP